MLDKSFPRKGKQCKEAKEDRDFQAERVWLSQDREQLPALRKAAPFLHGLL